LSALITEAIGIHAIFGAFVLGVIVPHDSRIARQLREQLEGVVVVLLLPAFFAFTGLRTQVGLLRGAEGWLLCGGIILVASLGKFGGSAAAARLTGLSWHDAAALGVLMNTRGLVELIVLNIGLDLHVLSPALFAMLVLMAIVTTVATTPLLALLQRGAGWEVVAAPAAAPPARPGARGGPGRRGRARRRPRGAGRGTGRGRGRCGRGRRGGSGCRRSPPRRCRCRSSCRPAAQPARGSRDRRTARRAGMRSRARPAGAAASSAGPRWPRGSSQVPRRT